MFSILDLYPTYILNWLIVVISKIRHIAQCYDFTIRKLASVDSESDKSPFLVPSLNASSTGIDMQEVKRLVILHFQNMTVPADEELWRHGINLRAYARIIITGISSDMLHQHLNVLTLEAQRFSIHQTKVAAVTVAAYSPERTEVGKSFGYLHRTDVACMPYFITRLKIFQIPVIPERMCIAKYSNLFHKFRLRAFCIYSFTNASVASSPSNEVLTHRS